MPFLFPACLLGATSRQLNRSMSDEKSSKRTAFANRMLSTICLWAVLLVAFWCANGFLFMILLAVTVTCGLLEYFNLFHEKGFRRYRMQAVVVGIVYTCLLFAPRLGLDLPFHEQLDSLSLAALLLILVFSRLRSPLDGRDCLFEIIATVFGFFYIVILSCYTAKVLLLPLVDDAGESSSQFYVLFLIAVTKLTDTGAYVVGSLIGKHKAVPHISPAKTWQGFGGAFLFSLITAFGCLYLMGNKIPLITPVHAAVLAVVLAFAAIIGDLAESIIKRSLEVKDSSHVMPGIGGVMDLIDSVLLTGPVFYFYLVFLV